MMKTADIYEQLRDKYQKGEFVGNTVEIIGATFIADEAIIIPDRPPNMSYIKREYDWYDSQSTNIYDIRGKTPQAWIRSADPSGEINSNYGYLIYSDDYHNQYRQAIRELKRNPDSRRACMVYQRPSIWKDYCENGKNDFICTYGVTYHIRDDKLHAHVLMRSNDAVFGYPNDFAWQKKVLYDMCVEMDIDMGDIIWTASSLHVYEPFYKYLEQ